MKEEILQRLEGMTKEEKIDYLEEWRFQIDMKDRWTTEDSERYSILGKIIKELEK